MDTRRSQRRDDVEADAIVALFSRQRDVYRALKGLADQQRGLVRTSESEGLLRLLGERQRLVAQLTAIDQEVRPLRERWQSVYQTMSAVHRRQVDGLLHEVQDTLAAILAADNEDARLLSARMAGTRQESARLNESRRAHAAYGAMGAGAGAGASGAARFIDQTDDEA